MMLTSDKVRLENKYPGAAEFLLAAALRYEAFVLARKPYDLMTSWEVDRLKSLLTKTPACREEWFVDRVTRDGSQYAKALVEEALS